jgi:chromosome segregation ATPase
MKIIETANGPGDARSSGAKSVSDGHLTGLEATLRRQKDWIAAQAASEPQDNLADVVSRERAARIALELELAGRQAQYEIDIARAEAVRAMIDEQIREAALEVERARHAEASAATLVARLARAEAEAVTRLSERETEFAAELSSIIVTREGLQRQLLDVQARVAQETEAREALERALTELRSAAAAAEQRFQEETAAIKLRALADRARLEDQLARERYAHEIQRGDEQQQHQSAIETAATRLAERETQFATELSALAATRDRLEQQLVDRHQRLVDVEARAAQETEAREALERAISELRSTAAEGEQRFREETAAIIEEARANHARLEDQLSREQHDHEIQLAEARAALDRTITELRSAAAAAEQRFREETAAIAEGARTDRARLEDQLSRERHDHETQLADEQQRHRSTRDSLQHQLVDVETRVVHETEAREALERTLTELRSATVAAEKRFREETAAITDEARANHARLEDQLSRERHDHETRLADEQQQHRSTRDSLHGQLVDVEARVAQETEAREALERALEELRSAAAAAEQRFREETAAIAEGARTDRARLEDQLSRERHDHETQLADEQQRHRSTRDSLQHQIVDVEARAAQEAEAREALERTLEELRSAAAAAEQRFREETAAIAEEARANHARLEDQLSRERHDHETQLADEQQRHRSTRDSLQHQIVDVEARAAQEAEAREALERTLEELRSAAAAAEQRFREETAAIAEGARTDRARLEYQLDRERLQATERQAAYQADIDREIAERNKVEAALARAHAALAERETELTSTRAEASATRSALERRVTDIDAELRDARSTIAAGATRLAERDAQIQEQLASLETGKHDRAQLRGEIRRQFEESPVALCRCTRDGVITDANQAFKALVGFRRHDDLRNPDVAASLFEAPADVSWLIENSVSSRRRAAVETTCRRKDGTHVAVRLTAGTSRSGLIEIAAEDLTPVRVLEDRLRQAHRMEAVGRIASEIAVTCGKLLGEIRQDAQHWLQTLGGSAAQRDSAERLLGDVTRVGSFLEQVVSYGHEQRAALTPVDLNKVLRDLEPLLKQVAGDEVLLEFGKTSSPISVDVTADRVERLLVNVASYGRERMPSGGRLKIELSTVVVDRKFTAQYHNVRPGPHALITVTELARPIDAERSRSADMAPGRPGVDLGVLQELITDCGGHLWITAEPGGSMVVKMRLPLRAAWDTQADRPSILGRIADV